jgi:hypothetical protein
MALSYPSAHPPDDSGSAELLASLRHVTSQLRESVLSGKPAAGLQAERVRLETRIRDRSRSVAGSEAALDRVDLEKLFDQLGERTLMSFFVLGETLHVVRVRRGKLGMFDLAPVAAISKEAYSLRFVVHRLLRGRASDAAEETALLTMEHAAGLLDLMILNEAGLAEEEVVIIPAGPLHGLPWRALPRLRTRSVTIAPSTRSWLHARSQVRGQVMDRTNGLKVLLVAGPGLPGAAAEVGALGRRYPGAQKLIGARATVGAVLSGMDGADLIHLAAHGSLRHDNPLFSSLAMADGPLTVYDLATLRRPPSLVVMPSCDTALSEVVSGDELLGLASGFMRAGVTSLIAPVAPIPDLATKSLMLAMHRELARRTAPARALAAATAHASSPIDLALASSFVCFGAG